MIESPRFDETFAVSATSDGVGWNLLCGFWHFGVCWELLDVPSELYLTLIKVESAPARAIEEVSSQVVWIRYQNVGR